MQSITDLPNLKAIILGNYAFRYSQITVLESSIEYFLLCADMSSLMLLKLGSFSLCGVKSSSSLYMESCAEVNE